MPAPCATGSWRKRIEVAFAPTALAEPLVGMGWHADTALRFLLTGADRLTTRPAPGLPFAFVNNYGPTECTVVATSGVVAQGRRGPAFDRAADRRHHRPPAARRR